MLDVQKLRELIETERERFGVPGVAVAVIADGEVVLAEGFGLRDVEGERPVTSSTLFPIASDTKCFTAATLCALADDGVLDLDAPVRQYVPWFRMSDPHATELVTTRDLLAHRTGLPRHDFVWYGEVDLTLEDVVRALPHLALSRPLRQTWQYNNLCFNTAGSVTEQLTGKAWPDAVRDRLLSPLGMSATQFEPGDPDADTALPYNVVKGALTRQLLPRKGRVGPAGGINSTITDMATWTLARLGRDADRVLSDAALDDLHSPAMIGGVGSAAFDERQPMGYGLGCQVESYRGTRIVRHGGNLVGYSSDVTVVPSLGAAIVVLTNMHGTALRDALPLMVIDRILEVDPAPWGERYFETMSAMLLGKADALAHHESTAAGRAPSRPLEDFAGSYAHPAYGTFTVTAVDGALVPDFHGLGERLALTHRDHDVWDLRIHEFDMAVPLVFGQGADASVASFTVPLEPQVDPIRFSRVPPRPEAGLLAEAVGSYCLGPHTLTVRRRGDELIATVPTAGALPLVAAGGARFTSPANSALSVEFQRDETGRVSSVVVDPIGIFART